jgi:hypothetical protein
MDNQVFTTRATRVSSALLYAVENATRSECSLEAQNKKLHRVTVVNAIGLIGREPMQPRARHSKNRLPRLSNVQQGSTMKINNT